MTSDNMRRSRRAGREAAERYVEADAHPGDRERSAALIEWLERSPDHEAALERCEAAVMLARELAARGELDELRAARHELDGQRAARRRSGTGVGAGARSFVGLVRTRAAPLRSSSAVVLGRRSLAALGRPAVAWSVAAAALGWALVASVEREAPVRPGDEARTAAAERASLPGSASPDAAAGGLADAAPAADVDVPMRSLIASNPVAVLPGDIVVDVHSVAVLPFDNAEASTSAAAVGDADERAAAARIARQLHDEVMGQLARIPGLYVVDGSSTAVYAGGELAPEEIAALLSVRGVVAAGVELDGRTVRVSLRMTDAAHAAWPTEIVLERPLDELPEVRTAIVANIADALDSTSF